MRAPTASFRTAIVVLFALAVTDMARRVGGWELAPLDGPLDRWGPSAIGLACVVLMLGRLVLRREQRLSWSALVLYVALTTGAELGFAIAFGGTGEPPVSNWTDGPHLLGYVFAAAGLALLSRGQSRGRVRVSIYLDGLVGGLSIVAVCAAVVLAPSGTPVGASGWEGGTATAYPVLDLLLVGLIGAAYGVRGWRVGRTWGTLVVAFVLVAVADVAYWWVMGRGAYDEAAWIDAVHPLSLILIAWAAWRPADPLRPRSEGYAVIEVPLAFAGLSLAVLVRAASAEIGVAAIVAAAAALVVTGIRTGITHHENVRLLLASRREADEDGLTGLPNRRRLMRDLDLAFTRGTGRSTLVFLDLDGFKAYNDAHGHLAGDGLLVEMGRALRAAVADGGAAYRLGGDEFCLLLPGAATARDPRIAGAVQALHGAGEDGVGVGASCGVVVLGREATSPTAALRLADTRMYDDKSFRRRSYPGSGGRGTVVAPPAPGERRAGLGPSL